MQFDRRRTLIFVVVAALAGLGGGIAIGLFSDDGLDSVVREPETDGPLATEPRPPKASEPETPSDNGPDGKLPPPESDPQGLEPGPSGPPPETADEQAAADAARAYIQALDLRRGGAVCRSFLPGLVQSLDFPVEREGCGATVDASLGYRHKGGLPVWVSSQMTDAVSATVDGSNARVVATIFTRYEDVRKPSIEDDVIYLRFAGGRWRIAKPSATIHRAIGNADVPPSVLTPP